MSTATSSPGGDLVLVLDDTPLPAIERAVSLAAAPVTLLGMVPQPPETQAGLTLGAEGRPVAELLVDARRHRLESAASALGGGIGVHVVCGDVRSVIDAFVTGDHGRVVVAGRRDAPARLVIARLIDLCPGPVLVDAAPERDPGTDVIVAVDPDAGPDLNRRLVATATAHARAAGGEVHLVHAWEVAGEHELHHGAVPDLPETELAAHALAVEAAHRRAFADAVEAAVPDRGPDDPPLTRHLVQGDPAEVVGRLAVRQRVGLVVTGSGGRTDVVQALDGSAARAIADDDHYATLVLKPEGFRSPLAAGADQASMS